MEVVVRDVWGWNLEDEMKLLRQCLHRFRIASLDTEFPGTIHTTRVRFSKLSPAQLYTLMKRNVNALKLIQLGLTLSDAQGNLPTLGSTQFQYVWQFNFRDFDPERDRQDPESVPFLMNHGMDFAKNRVQGIDSRAFALKFKEYVLLGRNLTWTTFDGQYDYGYLIKILTGRNLPHDYNKFQMLKQVLFGSDVHDTKQMANALGLYGGLEKIATTLNLERAAGRSHQAGSDSLLTMHLFLELAKNFNFNFNFSLRARVPIILVNNYLNHQTMYRGSTPLCPIHFPFPFPCSNLAPMPMH